MEIKITYIANDGRHFDDPIKCEDYEKTLGILPNSVADVLNTLQGLPPDDYIFGMLFIRQKDGTMLTYARPTVCCDSVLEDYVNVSDIEEDKRYMLCTVKGLINDLRSEDPNAPAQYSIIHSPNKDFKGFGIMASNNPLVWKKKEKL